MKIGLCNGGAGLPDFFLLLVPGRCQQGRQEHLALAEDDCLRGISLSQEAKCRDLKDRTTTLMEAAQKKGGVRRAGGVQSRGQRSLVSLPHPRALSDAPRTLSPCHLAGLQGPSTLGLGPAPHSALCPWGGRQAGDDSLALSTLLSEARLSVLYPPKLGS